MISPKGVDHSFHLSDHEWNAWPLDASPISLCQAPVQISLKYSLSLLRYTSLLPLEESAIWPEAYLKWQYEAWDIHRSQRNERTSGARLAGGTCVL